MAIIDSDEVTHQGQEGRRYTVELTSKNKPGFGLIDNQMLAERRARAALLARRRSLADDDVELLNVRMLRENRFTLRADYEVEFFVPVRT